jgi:hypothetical protein
MKIGNEDLRPETVPKYMCFILIAVGTVHTGKSVEYVSGCFSYVLYRPISGVA